MRLPCFTLRLRGTGAASATCQRLPFELPEALAAAITAVRASLTGRGAADGDRRPLGQVEARVELHGDGRSCTARLTEAPAGTEAVVHLDVAVYALVG